MLLTSAEMARKLTSAADRVEAVAGARPCRAFRPRGGWRSRTLFGALEHLDYKLVGWGWMLWDVELFQARSADRTVARVTARVSPGDIIVMHDGNDGAPRTAQRHTVEATARLIAALHARGLRFGTVCGNGA
jgi:peptidoglycan/xylan/chitin deacetylase (PgdA/CDA1 family)